jgi:hypothetical protein
MGFWDWLWSKAVAREAPASLANGRQLHALPPVTPSPWGASVPPVLAAPVVQPSPTARPGTPSASPSKATFDIEQAIDLMRALPLDDDPDLVLRVVRKTLRSVGVSVEEVVVSARAREEALVDRITNERDAIERLEAEIAERRKNIDRVMVVLEETQGVRTNLEDAMRSESKVGPLPISPDEIARIQAASPSAAPIPKVPPAAPSPLPKPSTPPRAGPPRSVPPRSTASRSTPPRPPPQLPKRPLVSAVPVVSDEADVFSEPTAKQLIAPKGDGPEKGAQ